MKPKLAWQSKEKQKLNGQIYIAGKISDPKPSKHRTE